MKYFVESVAWKVWKVSEEEAHSIQWFPPQIVQDLVVTSETRNYQVLYQRYPLLGMYPACYCVLFASNHLPLRESGLVMLGRRAKIPNIMKSSKLQDCSINYKELKALFRWCNCHVSCQLLGGLYERESKEKRGLQSSLVCIRPDADKKVPYGTVTS